MAQGGCGEACVPRLKISRYPEIFSLAVETTGANLLHVEHMVQHVPERIDLSHVYPGKKTYSLMFQTEWPLNAPWDVALDLATRTNCLAYLWTILLAHDLNKKRSLDFDCAFTLGCFVTIELSDCDAGNPPQLYELVSAVFTTDMEQWLALRGESSWSVFSETEHKQFASWNLAKLYMLQSFMIPMYLFFRKDSSYLPVWQRRAFVSVVTKEPFVNQVLPSPSMP